MKTVQSRRSVLGGLGLAPLAAAQSEASGQAGTSAPISSRDNLRITRLETFLVRPRWLFLKIHTNAGIVGLGELYLEGLAKTCAEGVKEVEPYLIGKDPRRVVHHWQAIYTQTCYHGGLILSSVLSGIDQALWDIKGKALGVPVYELLGGPTRDRVRIYAGLPSRPGSHEEGCRAGFHGFQDRFRLSRRRYVESRGDIKRAVERFAEARQTPGDDIDIAVDLHGNLNPATAKVLAKALEPYQPAWIEDPVQCENVDVLAEFTRSTHLPVCVGERLTTKWTVREVLEKQAASILNPDLSHAGGITEVRNIAALAETYYTPIQPHCPLDPIALAACIQSAAIPNFLMTEHTTLGGGYLKQPFTMKNGYVDLPAAPGLASNSTRTSWRTRSGTTGGIRKPTIPTMVRCSTGSQPMQESGGQTNSCRGVFSGNHGLNLLLRDEAGHGRHMPRCAHGGRVCSCLESIPRRRHRNRARPLQQIAPDRQSGTARSRHIPLPAEGSGKFSRPASPVCMKLN